MNTYKYTLTITAKEKKDADAKLKAMTILASKLSLKELIKLADIVQNDPIKTAMAKTYLGV